MSLLSILVYILSSLFIGVLAIGLSLNLVDLSILVSYLEKSLLAYAYPRFIIFLIGILVILLLLRFLQQLFVSSKKEKAVTLQTSQGVVSITLSAIEEMIKKILEGKEEISGVKSKIISTRREINVTVRLTLNSQVNLPRFIEDIQGELKEKLRGMLGEEKDLKLKVEVRKIVFPSKKEEPNLEEREVPFRKY